MRRPVTWTDYQRWGTEQRFEILAGDAYAMSPAPPVLHQQLVVTFCRAFGAALEGHRCQVLISPVDVRLSETNVVQPDLVVVCDPEQLTASHIEGAPTLVVEILSPSSSRHDRVRKLKAYLEARVEEYWLVTPETPMLEVLRLQGQHYVVDQTYTDRGWVQSSTLPAVRMDLEQLFRPCGGSQVEEVRECSPAYQTQGGGSPDLRLR